MYSLILNDPIQFITYNLIKGDELKVILIIINNCSLEINYSHEYLQGIWRMKIALFGASGFVGSYILDSIIEKGFEPSVLVREGSEN